MRVIADAVMITSRSPTAHTRWRHELSDFFYFVAHPALGPRAAPRAIGSQGVADWCSGVVFGRLVKWALFLWAINLVVLGPIAVAASTAGGAQHRLDIHAIPWLQALLWAPIIEEMVFRYSLRRFFQAWWVLPVAIAIMFSGPTITAQLALTALLLVCWLSARRQPAARPAQRRFSPGQSWRVRCAYRRLFPWVFHVSSLAFAAVHLHNFNFYQTPLWLMPLLVLPQWLTGLVLGWQRVRYGIGASIVLHSLFNAGPLLLVWVALQTLPDMAL